MFKQILLFSVLLICVPTFGQNTDSTQVVKDLAKAKQLLLEGNNAAAKQKITKAYEVANVNFWTHLKGQASILLGDLYAMENKRDLSLEQYHLASRFFTQNNSTKDIIRAKQKTAQLYTRYSYHSQALKEYKEVVVLKKKVPETISSTLLELLARLCIIQNRTDEAQIYIKEALNKTETVEHETKLMLLSAQLYVDANKIDSAIVVTDNILINAAQLPPSLLAQVYNAKGFALIRQQNAVEAKTVLQQAVKLINKVHNNEMTY